MAIPIQSVKLQPGRTSASAVGGYGRDGKGREGREGGREGGRKGKQRGGRKGKKNYDITLKWTLSTRVLDGENSRSGPGLWNPPPPPPPISTYFACW